MKILNFGSLNLDQVFLVQHIVKPGETISSSDFRTFEGGKGLNQSIALANAGMQHVFHAGQVGEEGTGLIEKLQGHRVSTQYIKVVKEPTGRAIIQVEKSGQNSIVLLGGANKTVEKTYIDTVLADFGENDILILQNEINNIGYIMQQAFDKKMKIVFNPSPANEQITSCPLDCVSLFLINETEGTSITGEKTNEKILNKMITLYPESATVLTLGGKGVCFKSLKESASFGIFDVPVIDTTAAGDTFTGFFIAEYFSGSSLQEALYNASLAASLAVSKNGACNSIPTHKEVEKEKTENRFPYINSLP